MEKDHNGLKISHNATLSNAASSLSTKLRPLADHSSTSALFKVLHNSNTNDIKSNNHSNDVLSMQPHSSSLNLSSGLANNHVKQKMFNIIKSISNSASMIVSSMNAKTYKNAMSIISSQSTSDSISASVRSFLVKKSTSVSIANSDYNRFNAISSLNFSNSLSNASVINSTKVSASSLINVYHDKNQQQAKRFQNLKQSYAQLSNYSSSAARSIQVSASASASSHVQAMINSNLSQVMSLSDNIKTINQNTYQAINQANISALDVIKNLKRFNNSQASSRLTASQSSQSNSLLDRD